MVEDEKIDVFIKVKVDRKNIRDAKEEILEILRLEFPECDITIEEDKNAKASHRTEINPEGFQFGEMDP